MIYTQNDFDLLNLKLHSLADEGYKIFQSKLLPGLQCSFLGVRIPLLRKEAKELLKQDYIGFLNYAKDSNIYEIIMLYGMVISQSNMHFEIKLSYLDLFIPKIDNWAVCDTIVSDLKCVKHNLDTMLSYITKYLTSPNDYELRFAIVVLLQYYINDNYINQVLSIYNQISHDGYYVKMAVAWGISICFIKYRSQTLAFLKNNSLDNFTHNKAIQKIKESHRVDNKDKYLLSSLKR